MEQIRFLIPEGPFYNTLIGLLGGLPGRRVEAPGEAEDDDKRPPRVVLPPRYPPEGQPELAVQPAPLDWPQVQFDLPEPFGLWVGALRLGSRLPNPQPEREVEPPAESEDEPDEMPFELLTGLFGAHLRGLDHAGLDLPPDLLPHADWQALVRRVAAQSLTFRYPRSDLPQDGGTHEWVFLLPQAAEGAPAPDEFPAGVWREPKFELAYDSLNRLPGLHFHLRTGLPAEAVRARLPAPYGFQLPGVETYRSVYVFTPWVGVRVRFDLGFAPPGDAPTPWDDGLWLAQNGQRIFAD